MQKSSRVCEQHHGTHPTDLAANLSIIAQTVSLGHHSVLAFAPQVTEPGGRHQEGGTTDIWEDTATLPLLMHWKPPAGTCSIRQSCRGQGVVPAITSFRDISCTAMEWMANHKWYQSPQNASIRSKMHAATKHIGTRRTLTLLVMQYLWNGITEDVVSVVRH